MVIDDRVLAIAAPEHIRVVSCTTAQLVVACTAIENIVTRLSKQPVIPYPTKHAVYTRAAIQMIASGAAVKDIATLISVEGVVARVTDQQIRPHVPADRFPVLSAPQNIIGDGASHDAGDAQSNPRS